MTITWEALTHDKSHIIYMATQESSDDADIKAAVSELWLKLLAEIDARYQAEEWSCIYLSLWPDSGRIIGYPNDQPPVDGRAPYRTDERVCVWVELRRLEELFFAVPDEEEVKWTPFIGPRA